MKKKIYTAAAITMSMLLATGCSGLVSNNNTNTTSSEEVDNNENSVGTEASDKTVSDSDNTASGISDMSMDTSEYFTDRDLDPSYDESEAVKITLSDRKISADGEGVSVDGTTATITKEGVYIFEGTISDGQIIVEATDTDKVQIVLNGVDITNDDSACIFVKEADKVFVTLADGTENTLSDTGKEFVQTDDGSTVDGVVFSRDDITFNGTGTLNINASYDHGIVGKDDLKIAGGTYNIKAAGKGLAANDSIRIASGNVNINSEDDSIHTSNGDDEGKGYIYVAGGTFNLSSGDDGIHAEQDLLIDGGIVTVSESVEGLEGVTVTINGGTFDITASDDGINAAGGNDTANTESEFGFFGGGGHGGMNDTQEEAIIDINGGEVYVNAGGDGIDANGYIYIDGGVVNVDGPTNDGNAPIDYGLGIIINGGELIAAGSSGMLESVSEESKQYNITYVFSETQSAGTTVQLLDESGNVVMEYTPSKQFNAVVLSSDKLTDGTYTIKSGSYEDTIEVSSVVTSNGKGGIMGPGGQMNPGGQMGPGGQDGMNGDNESGDHGPGGRGGRGGMGGRDAMDGEEDPL